MSNITTQRSGTSERALRSLQQLEASASTSRTLNLVSVWRRHSETEEFRAAPFFLNPVLNRSIILKHRLRSNELADFAGKRTSATKVILPIDPSNLRAGARSFFVSQHGYRALLDDIATGDPKVDSRDEALLLALDELPSLDPFLMRERLRKVGVAPSRCYFELTDADSARMLNFTRSELAPLIGASFDDLQVGHHEKAAKFAEKILSNSGDAELDPLRIGLGMERAEFEEGVFCWKGFIYYKWALNELVPQIKPVATEIERIKPTNPLSSDERAYIDAARERLGRGIVKACTTVRLTLKVYDDAYHDLTRNGQPAAFREFLIKAPTLFHELGERLGGVQHLVSFWRYRFPPDSRPKISSEELFDLFADFEASLSFEDAGKHSRTG